MENITPEIQALRALLADNIRALMLKSDGAQTLTDTRLGAAIGAGTISGILSCTRAARLDTVAKLAGLFKHDPWRLLAPNLGEGIGLWPFGVEQARYDALSERQKGEVEGALRAAIERCEQEGRPQQKTTTLPTVQASAKARSAERRDTPVATTPKARRRRASQAR
jgi:hypothetical protein